MRDKESSNIITGAWAIPGALMKCFQNPRFEYRKGFITTIENSDQKINSDKLIMPPICNTHDHARFVRLSQINSYDIPLEAWLPYLKLIPSIDAYLSSAVSFARSALGGVSSVMAHYTRVQGLTTIIEEAEAVARAACDVGINLAFAVHCRDINPLVYGNQKKFLNSLSKNGCKGVEDTFLKPYKSFDHKIQITDHIGNHLKKFKTVTVQYGPAGVQWCSRKMLEKIAENSLSLNRNIHMHFLETIYQRHWLDKEFPNGVTKYLDDIGFLSSRLSLAHCIYLREEEMEILAERGVTIVINSSSNLIVSSGLASVAKMLERGCKVAMGLDGLAFDEDEDSVREMRLTYNLHKALGFNRYITKDQIQTIAMQNGYRVITKKRAGGSLKVGQPADFLSLNWKKLSQELIEPIENPLDLVLAKGTKHFINGLVVNGREVVKNSKVETVDLPLLENELFAVIRSKIGETSTLRKIMPELKEAYEKYYCGQWHCC